MDKTKHLQTKYSLARYNLIKECDDEELRFYLFVKLYAINQNSAFPSQKTFEEELNWSKYKTARVVKKMEQKDRLKVKRTQGKNNIYDITWYDLINENLEKKNQSTSSSKKPIEEKKIKQEQQVQQFVGSEINSLIALFESVNPSYKKFFFNKTERSSLERMVYEHGEEKIRKLIGVLSQTNQEQYAPMITSPYQLESKIGSLLYFLQRKKADQIKNKVTEL